LARDGQSEPTHIEETDTTFAIGWKESLSHRRAGLRLPPITIPAGVATIIGYPTDKLSEDRFDRKISNIFG